MIKTAGRITGVLLSFYIMSFAAVGIILMGSVLIAILFYIGIGGGRRKRSIEINMRLRLSEILSSGRKKSLSSEKLKSSGEHSAT